MRRKIQEEHPHLRGRLYVDRKGKLQDKWKKDLGYE
jgi:peptide deformylase